MAKAGQRVLLPDMFTLPDDHQRNCVLLKVPHQESYFASHHFDIPYAPPVCSFMQAIDVLAGLVGGVEVVELLHLALAAPHCHCRLPKRSSDHCLVARHSQSCMPSEARHHLAWAQISHPLASGQAVHCNYAALQPTEDKGVIAAHAPDTLPHLAKLHSPWINALPPLHQFPLQPLPAPASLPHLIHDELGPDGVDQAASLQLLRVEAEEARGKEGTTTWIIFHQLAHKVLLKIRLHLKEERVRQLLSDISSRSKETNYFTKPVHSVCSCAVFWLQKLSPFQQACSLPDCSPSC